MMVGTRGRECPVITLAMTLRIHVWQKDIGIGVGACEEGIAGDVSDVRAHCERLTLIKCPECANEWWNWRPVRYAKDDGR